MFKEARFSNRPAKSEHQIRQEVGVNLLAMLIPHLLQLREKLTQLINPEFKLWSSTTYFREKRLSLAELHTFLDEYVGMFAVKTYDYSPYGIPDGGPPLLTSQRCLNHKQELEAAGGETARADLETWVALSLEAWMADPNQPLEAKVISISPRGTLKEGYPGEKRTNYVFVNVYQKVEPAVAATGFQLTQFMSYDTNEQLAELLEKLGQQHQTTLFQPIQLPSQPEKASHQLITQLRLLPPDISLEHIKNAVQQHSPHWPIKLSDLPALPLTKFKQQQELIMEYCQQQFEQLLASNSPDAIEDFDLLITTVRSWFLKWSEANATNYDLPQSQVFKNPEELIQVIEEDWQLALKKKNNELTREEQSRFQDLKGQVKLSPLTPLFRLSSVAHCIVGTPSSLALQSLNINQLASLKAGGSWSVESLSLLQKQELQGFVQTLTKISVLKQETGQLETYYLQLADPKYAADYQTGCYKKLVDGEEVLFGPCDIPLSEDNLIVEGSIMTEVEYKQLQTALAQEQLTTTESELLHNSNLSVEERTIIKRVFALLSAQLFTTSLTSFISGVTETRAMALLALPAPFWQSLRESANPVPVLKNLLLELELPQLQALEAGELNIDELPRTNSPHSISSANNSIIGHHGRHFSATGATSSASSRSTSATYHDRYSGQSIAAA